MLYHSFSMDCMVCIVTVACGSAVCQVRRFVNLSFISHLFFSGESVHSLQSISLM
jgi:hypothetical protein